MISEHGDQKNTASLFGCLDGCVALALCRYSVYGVPAHLLLKWIVDNCILTMINTINHQSFVNHFPYKMTQLCRQIYVEHMGDKPCNSLLTTVTNHCYCMQQMRFLPPEKQRDWGKNNQQLLFWLLGIVKQYEAIIQPYNHFLAINYTWPWLLALATTHLPLTPLPS